MKYDPPVPREKFAAALYRAVSSSNSPWQNEESSGLNKVSRIHGGWGVDLSAPFPPLLAGVQKEAASGVRSGSTRPITHVTRPSDREISSDFCFAIGAKTFFLFFPCAVLGLPSTHIHARIREKRAFDRRAMRVSRG